MAGEIEAVDRAQTQRRASLANLDAALLLFDSSGDPTLIRAIRPVERGTLFRFEGKPVRWGMQPLRLRG